MGVTGITGGQPAFPKTSSSFDERAWESASWLPGQEVKIDKCIYGVAQTPTRLLERQRSDPSSLQT